MIIEFVKQMVKILPKIQRLKITSKLTRCDRSVGRQLGLQFGQIHPFHSIDLLERKSQKKSVA